MLCVIQKGELVHSQVYGEFDYFEYLVLCKRQLRKFLLPALRNCFVAKTAQKLRLKFILTGRVPKVDEPDAGF